MMKGRLALRTVVLLVIAIIVMGIALYFLVYLTSFDALFLSNDQRILKQFSTCALAYCSSGGAPEGNQLASDQVNRVGCLISKSGGCELSCADVQIKIYDANGVSSSFIDPIDKRPHYCGREAALEFEFSGVSLGGTVPLRSGEMDRIAAAPSWVCKSLKIPIIDAEIDDLFAGIPGYNLAGFSSADAQYNGNFGVFGFVVTDFSVSKTCIMLSKSVTDSEAYANTLIFVGTFVATGGIGKVAGKASQFAFGILEKAFKGIESAASRGATKAFTGGTAAAGAEATQITDVFENQGLKSKGGCFSGYVYYDKLEGGSPRLDVLYTPIIQYNDEKYEKVYPSAIYVDRSFTSSIDGTEPECTFANPTRAIRRNVEFDNGNTNIDGEINAEIADFVETFTAERTQYYLNDPQGTKEYEAKYGKDADFEKVILAEAKKAAVTKFGTEPIKGIDIYAGAPIPFSFGNMIKECKFKIVQNGEKIKYKIWASPTFPGVGTTNLIAKNTEEIIEGSKFTIDSLVDFVAANADKIGDSGFPIVGQLGDQIAQALKDANQNIANFFGKQVDVAQDWTDNAFQRFGSCAYVTLERELPKGGFETVQEQVKDISIQNTGSDVYTAGQFVKFSGKLEMEVGSPEGKKIIVELIQNPIPPFTLKAGEVPVTTDKDGAFSGEIEIKSPAGTGTWGLIAKYGGKTSTPAIFQVG